MSVSNIIDVTFGSDTLVFVQNVTSQRYQYNEGIYLNFTDLDLPSVWTAEFCNEGVAPTYGMVGSGTQVEIPVDVMDNGKAVYCYVMDTSIEDTVITMAEVRIPPIKRAPRPEGTEPTPSQQTLVEQALTALNNAVEAIEDMTVSAETLAEGSSATVTKIEQDGVVNLEFGIPKGQAGDTPTITASKTGKTTSIYVDGSEVAQIEDGTDGDDGYSPTASVTKSGKTATITITDENGTTSAQVEDGTDGTDGISPTVTITPITGGHRITIIDADGEHSADVMDGTGNVDDVQINGTSIVNDGVANVPIASANVLGLVKKIDPASYGINISSDGNLMIYGATSNAIKQGVNSTSPITTFRQHESVFYGLAKAAGDTTQKSSSNAVGTYTDSAIDSIMSMLGIDDLIAPHESAQASQAYAVGACFIYNGKLYKATSAIALGDAIAPDTNCTQTTLVELINS